MPADATPAPNALRALPSVDRALEAAGAAGLLAAHPRPRVVAALRAELDAARAAIKAGGAASPPDAAALCTRAAVRLAAESRPGMCRVINATGVVLHTGLGRAPLPPAALAALQEAARGYCLLEVDRASGERGERETPVRALLCELTGAQAATVVNNNAAATLIMLAALGRGREVIVSRGQLVEIGGAFRIPAVMAESGAVLREVGTTNRTHLKDYAEAIGPQTGLLLRVHTSNYRVMGFTAEVALPDLVALARQHGLAVVDDLGSGALVDLSPYGLAGEPVVRESLAAGADVVCFSGDKLLGGPQAGILVGTTGAIAKIRRHPLFRAMRPDKMQLIALEATLRLYRDPDTLARTVPTFAMLTADRAALRPRADALAASLRGLAGASVAVVDDVSAPGSGALPTVEIPTVVVAVGGAGGGAEALATRLRRHEPPVFARVREGRLLLDVRTLLPGEESEVAAAVAATWA